jgi:mannitol-specific phosphotransferase system IIBC component
MDPKKVENLVQVLSDYLEDAGVHEIEVARAAIKELDELTDGAVTWDDFISDEEDEG